MADVILMFDEKEGDLIITTDENYSNDLFITFDKNEKQVWTRKLGIERQKDLIKKLVANL